MRVVVCIRQGLDGEINPFDACAYEAALCLPNAEITLLSMAPLSAKDFLLKLTRLGAKKAILLTDSKFVGADTLATAYTLSLAIRKLNPDLTLCGRQTLIGDTGQTGAMLSVFAGLELISSVMNIDSINDGKINCTTRDEGKLSAALPALITVERINSLRMPRLRSSLGEIELWDAKELNADEKRIGLQGSPTRVIKTFENTGGKRNCKFISADKLKEVIVEGLNTVSKKQKTESECKEKLASIVTVGDSPIEFAKSVSDNITVIPLTTKEDISEKICTVKPSAVLFGSDSKSKRLAAQVAAMLKLGLCADCTSLEAENDNLIMYRPALSGSIIAKIKSLTSPAMATVRTESETLNSITVCAGFGVRDKLDDVKKFADSISASLSSTRKLVDNGFMRYDAQVGLTGKTVSPPIYIAIGVSGAVHHIVGMQRSGTVIAINPDKNAPIFEYADYGIVEEFDINKLL